jgi:hypothetical protein
MSRTYEEILTEISRELALKFSSPDDPGLFERRQRLKGLFEAVPDDRAEELRGQLGDRATSDPLSKQFHGRLSTPTRRQMLGILDAKIAASSSSAEPEPEPEPTPVVVSPRSELPADAGPRWRAAREALAEAIAAADDPRKDRYACWLATAQMGGDDRVIEWRTICPSTSGAVGAALIIGPCDITSGMSIDQTRLEATVATVADVETRGDGLGVFTHLRSQIVFDHETLGPSVESFRFLHDQVQRAIQKLDLWANSPIPVDGADRAITPPYVALKDWIVKQQKNSDSIYSCF